MADATLEGFDPATFWQDLVYKTLPPSETDKIKNCVKNNNKEGVYAVLNRHLSDNKGKSNAIFDYLRKEKKGMLRERIFRKLQFLSISVFVFSFSRI